VHSAIRETLLVCALAHRALGEVAESERLELAAESLAMEGYDLQSAVLACDLRS